MKKQKEELDNFIKTINSLYSIFCFWQRWNIKRNRNLLSNSNGRNYLL